MAKEMKGITYCGECIYYNKKQHRCTAGAFVETDPKRTFYDDCPLPKVVPAQRWIPVTDRLPEPFDVVYVYDRTRKRVTDAYMTRHMEWVGVCMNHEVTHWMPMPEPPTE